MSDGATALRAAVALLHSPSRVKLARSSSLPTDAGFLLRIASGDAAAIDTATTLIQRPESVVVKASEFFIQQVLLAPDCDSYRVLGGSAETTTPELRQNMVLLLKWLHPDRGATAEHTIYAARITKAWGDVKTEEKRAAYDAQLSLASTAPKRKPSPNVAFSGNKFLRRSGRHVAVVDPRDTNRKLSFWRSTLALFLGKKGHE